ncbi:type IA DNA topoisomerase [Bacillus sp. N447-1]|uniref:type IA DNA topoisomerase n=1 Tax=Bacillus TaxID=1386 RepID=UPI001F609BBB|nr:MULTISPECIES: type IA DNA topoisomerase [Bacillus]MDA2145826.1 DNA topoisomerase [Bacillus cereus group sp. Bc248]MDA2173676.1 DNA topoisomerase [Bacillus cereus group sp. Bc247]MDA2664045.1 DNA topoisomerase [Bacillus cereus group sp. Bc032]MDA2674763.1 DNA topoisomerase [Bacillus cereus group sp. Bc031]MDA2680167.1 DNA topoisomerase [Bacillus cereus group sp. Bc029]
MKAVIIAEKPSVAKNIADALKIKKRNDGYYEGNNYIVTWAFGHLLQLYDAKDYDEKMAKWQMDNFPFIPEKFQYKVKSSPKDRDKADSGAKKQLNIIRSLLFREDVDSIISACDYDREGQVIGDSVIYNIKAPKQVYRLLLNEWTPDEVNAGLKQIRPNSDLRPLQDAGVSRQWADWAIGINLTSVATLKYQKGTGQALNIGRVLLPTLKIIYDRDKEIETFVPENYYKLVATFKTQREEEFEATYLEEQEEKFKNKATLDEIYNILQRSSGEVIDKQVEQKREYPPFLFNLSNLQGYVTSKYKGWTSDKVLKVAQSLYEKKYITYPRTGSTALEESLVGRAAKVLEAVKKGLPYEDEISFVKTKRVFNNAKVESHSAIMPTYLLPKSLTSDEQIVYTAVKNRFIMQFMPVAEHEETRIQIKISDSSIKGVFIAKGRVQIVEGWRKVEKIESKDKMLPFVEFKENLEITNADVTSHVTKPPKHHTEKTLLRVMETCGKNYDEEEAVLSGFSIGTPATRAETIKKLKDIGYIFSKDKSLLCSELGRKIVETFPVKELFDLEFTGKLEKALSDMEKKKVSRSVFLNFIFDFTRKSVEMIKNDQDVILHHVTREPKEVEVLGKCPICSNAIVEGQKGFGCSDWKNGCKFVVWKNDKFLATMKKKPTKTMVKKLLKDGEALVKGLTSKKGNKFDAILRYEKNPENEFFSWKMSFVDNQAQDSK